jgi:hypothetical protein
VPQLREEVIHVTKNELRHREVHEQHVQLLPAREAMSLLYPWSGGAFGMAAASDVAAEPSPMDDVYTIQ